MASTRKTDYDAVVIGAGFAGIRTLWELRQRGLTVKCFEAGGDIGGVWYWNRYPGARTDSEAWVYAMNFAPEVKDVWDYRERYPGQEEVETYLNRVADRFHLRKSIQFNTYIDAAHWHEDQKVWTIRSADGKTTTCRYFIPATGPLSVAKKLPFPGLASYTGQWYETSKWPIQQPDFTGKRVAIIGTGATGVQIIPKIAPAVAELTVFQRTPNYVLPGRNYTIDDLQASEIKGKYNQLWSNARSQGAGLAMKPSGKTLDTLNPQEARRLLDAGWEDGGFHYHFETLDDIYTNPKANELVADYVRQKIRAVVKDPNTAELLCPKYPYLAKRPPCGHFYYEAFNRPNVGLVDISEDAIDLYERGIRTESGVEYEVDIVVFALGFDAATGALSEMDVRGKQGLSLAEAWDKSLETFAGVLVPHFPNMFPVCGPHVPFGNMPVVLDIQIDWIGKVIAQMEGSGLGAVEASDKAVRVWSDHVKEAFEATIFAAGAKTTRSWFVGANIPGKPERILFYFGGVPAWTEWLVKEAESGWQGLKFTRGSSDGWGRKHGASVI
ncbi:Baeyer-Villiger monooxygenase [Aspergillus carlsbadensis]|nr:Baeyer-Villiger monooxygenase [Aspergillus carlsbadensis]